VGNLGALPVCCLRSQVLAVVLKPLPSRPAPKSLLCNVQLACPLAAKGSYLSANCLAAPGPTRGEEEGGADAE
jgi:hypothetical protein